MYLALEYVAADHVSIVVAESDAVAKAEPTRASANAMLVAVAAPSTGVTRVGVLANTRAPVPVSSEITPASSEDDVAARSEILLDVVIPFVTVAAFHVYSVADRT